MGKCKYRRSISLVLALWFGVLTLGNPLVVCAKDEAINGTNWMSEIDDDYYLSQISIPGTHDSGTQFVDFGYVMKCQNTNISKQLTNGFRYLDLRVCVEDTEDGESRLNIVHNFANCKKTGGLFAEKLYFEDVTDSVYSFLEDNPTETVIVNIKIEDDDHTIADVQKLLHEELSAHSEMWLTENEIPTLGEARGKIVLMTRFNDAAGLNETGILLQWDEQNNKTPVDIPYELYVTDACRLWVQDRYKYDVEHKIEAVIDGLENCEADENTIFLNFVSTSGEGKIGHPKGYAKELNKLILNYELNSETSYGIIIFDFGTAKIARHIYETNF